MKYSFVIFFLLDFISVGIFFRWTFFPFLSLYRKCLILLHLSKLSFMLTLLLVSKLWTFFPLDFFFRWTFFRLDLFSVGLFFLPPDCQPYSQGRVCQLTALTINVRGPGGWGEALGHKPKIKFFSSKNITYGHALRAFIIF